MKKPETLSKNQIFKKYLFYLWDGLGFFGFDDTKLARIKNKRPGKYMDSCGSFKWSIANLLALIVAVFIISSEVGNLGKIKSKSVTLVPADIYHYDINFAFNWLGVFYFYLSELVPKVRNHQWNNLQKRTEAAGLIPKFRSTEAPWQQYTDA
jgi:hypothetical protein